MEQLQGLTAEMYRAVVAIVDDRMKEIRVTRQNFDRLVRAHARTEKRVEALAEAQAHTEEEFRRYREESEARWAQIEAALNRLAEAQARTEEAQARTEAQVRALTEAQARTEEELRKYREASEARWAQIEAALNRLAEAQARTEEAQARTEAQVRALTEAQARIGEAQARTEEELRKYREASEARWARMEEESRKYREAAEARWAQIEAALNRLAEAQAETERRLQKWIDRQGAVEGRLLELTYQQKAGVYFGPLLRRPRAVTPVEIEDQVESRLSREEFLDLLAADLLVSGYPRYRPEAPQVWLVVEVSATVDRHDVERARRRAGLLRRAGLRAIPVVAGEDATLGARDEAEAYKVLMLQDSRAFFWEEALAEALGESPEA